MDRFSFLGGEGTFVKFLLFNKGIWGIVVIIISLAIWIAASIIFGYLLTYLRSFWSVMIDGIKFIDKVGDSRKNNTSVSGIIKDVFGKYSQDYSERYVQGLKNYEKYFGEGKATFVYGANITGVIMLIVAGAVWAAFIVLVLSLLLLLLKFNSFSLILIVAPISGISLPIVFYIFDQAAKNRQRNSPDDELDEFDETELLDAFVYDIQEEIPRVISDEEDHSGVSPFEGFLLKIELISDSISIRYDNLISSLKSTAVVCHLILLGTYIVGSLLKYFIMVSSQ